MHFPYRISSALALSVSRLTSSVKGNSEAVVFHSLVFILSFLLHLGVFAYYFNYKLNPTG